MYKSRAYKRDFTVQSERAEIVIGQGGSSRDSYCAPHIYNHFPSFFSRPHKFPDGSKSKKRVIWEWGHKLAGRLALIFALINICLGLFLAVVPTAGWAIWYAMLGVLVLAYIVMEIRLRVQNQRSGVATFPLA